MPRRSGDSEDVPELPDESWKEDLEAVPSETFPDDPTELLPNRQRGNPPAPVPGGDSKGKGA